MPSLIVADQEITSDLSFNAVYNAQWPVLPVELGSGRDRTVFALDDNYVLKWENGGSGDLPSSGNANHAEVTFWTEFVEGTEHEHRFAKPFLWADNLEWIIAERIDCTRDPSQEDIDEVERFANQFGIYDIWARNVGYRTTDIPWELVIVDYAD